MYKSGIRHKYQFVDAEHSHDGNRSGRSSWHPHQRVIRWGRRDNQLLQVFISINYVCCILTRVQCDIRDRPYLTSRSKGVNDFVTPYKSSFVMSLGLKNDVMHSEISPTYRCRSQSRFVGKRGCRCPDREEEAGVFFSTSRASSSCSI